MPIRARARSSTHLCVHTGLQTVPKRSDTQRVPIEVQTTYWLFGRGSETVKIERLGDGGGEMSLVITANADAPRRYEFDSVRALTRFQADMEEFLVTTGWALLEFFPERRTGRDRRTFPRLTERRRWWTDALRRRKRRS